MVRHWFASSKFCCGSTVRCVTPAAYCEPYRHQNESMSNSVQQETYTKITREPFSLGHTQKYMSLQICVYTYVCAFISLYIYIYIYISVCVRVYVFNERKVLTS